MVKKKNVDSTYPIELELNLLHDASGAVVTFFFTIYSGYPFKQNSFLQKFNISSQHACDMLQLELDNLFNLNNSQPCCTPLSRTWNRLISILCYS